MNQVGAVSANALESRARQWSTRNDARAPKQIESISLTPLGRVRC